MNFDYEVCFYGVQNYIKFPKYTISKQKTIVIFADFLFFV